MNVTFALNPKQGYWFGLCMWGEGETTSPLYKYDKEEARNHYGLCAFPDDYGSSGENTFIICEEGTVYSLDKGEGKYDPEYPRVDPTSASWCIGQ